MLAPVKGNGQLMSGARQAERLSAGANRGNRRTVWRDASSAVRHSSFKTRHDLSSLMVRAGQKQRARAKPTRSSDAGGSADRAPGWRWSWRLFCWRWPRTCARPAAAYLGRRSLRRAKRHAAHARRPAPHLARARHNAADIYRWCVRRSGSSTTPAGDSPAGYHAVMLLRAPALLWRAVAG